MLFYINLVSPRGSVSINPQITNSFNGSSVTLTCSAEGGPNNTFQWTYSRTGEVVSTTTQYTLTASITTGGEYQCTVTNGAGNDTDNATVNGEQWTLMYSIFISVVIMSFFKKTFHFHNS